MDSNACIGFLLVPGNYGTFAPKNFCSREQKYHGLELSLPGTFVPRNFRSLELSLQRRSFMDMYAYAVASQLDSKAVA